MNNKEEFHLFIDQLFESAVKEFKEARNTICYRKKLEQMGPESRQYAPGRAERVCG